MSEVVSPHWSNEEWTWLERRAAGVQRRGFNAALEYGQSASGEPIAAISVDSPDGRFRQDRAVGREGPGGDRRESLAAVLTQ